MAILVLGSALSIADNACDSATKYKKLSQLAEDVDVDSALFLAERAMDYFDACNNDMVKGRVLIWRAGMYESKNDHERAIDDATRAYFLGKKISPQIRASAAILLFSIYETTGNGDLAGKYIKEAIQLGKEYNIDSTLITAYLNYGGWVFEDYPDSSFFYFEEAERLSAAINDTVDLFHSRMSLATLYAMQGEFSRSVTKFKQLQQGGGMAEVVYNRFFINLNLGNVYQDMGIFDSAQYYMNVAAGVADEMDIIEYKSYISEALYGLFKSQEMCDSALLYLEAYLNQRDSFLNLERVNAITAMRETFEAEKRERDIRDLEQANHISDLQRNFFIVLTFLFLAIAAAVAVVYNNRIQTSRLLSEQRIRELEKEKEVLSLQSMLFAQEEERQRIARDLHDSIGALLSAARLHISNIEEEVRKLSQLDFIKTTGEVIDRASKEVRRVAHDMMPGVLMKLGLTEGIEDFFDRLRSSNTVKVSFTYDDLPGRLENKAEVMIYRMVQELVNNTIKHADASEIKLMIKLMDDRLILDYRDDGKGFDPDELDNQGNFGLTGLKSRVNFLGGSMELSSSPGQGVHFVISIPVKFTGL